MYPLTKSGIDYYHRTMEKEKPKIQVRDIESQQVLFECDLHESERAWQFAAEMEELGLDIEVVNPTLGETLSHSLGVSKEDLEAYKQSMEEEIESHDDSGSCCFTTNSDKIIQ